MKRNTGKILCGHFFNLWAQCQPASLLPLLGRVHCQQPMDGHGTAGHWSISLLSGPSECYLCPPCWPSHKHNKCSMLSYVQTLHRRGCLHPWSQSSSVYKYILEFCLFFFQTNTNVELIGRDNTDPCSCRRLGIYGRLSWSQFYQL